MSDINITNNFNAPIGQHIDHVDTINLKMDGDGEFQFGMVEKVNEDETSYEIQNDVELFHFIHPSVNEDEGMRIHNEVKRLVKRHGVMEICRYPRVLEKEKKIQLPQMASVAYAELIRIGMPQGEGYGEKNFMKNYNKIG